MNNQMTLKELQMYNKIIRKAKKLLAEGTPRWMIAGELALTSKSLREECMVNRIFA